MRLVQVRFRQSGKRFTFDAGTLDLRPNDKVAVQLEKGIALATVVDGPAEAEPPGDRDQILPVLRKATDEDLDRARRLRERARQAFTFCQGRIQARALPMKLVDVEFLLDESRATFYFTAEGRVDFRELVRDLAHEFRTRIEMMQIGVRDESKILGGYGICGRELCCSSWLVKFNPVSIRMAKDQSLSLNPTKVSGVCGRLMCCLAYEHDQYLQLIDSLPRLGKRYVCAQGPCRITRIDVLGQRVFAAMEDGSEVEVSGQQLQAAVPQATSQGREPTTPEIQPQPIEEGLEDAPDASPLDDDLPDAALEQPPNGPTEPQGENKEAGTAPTSGKGRRSRRRRRKRHGGPKQENR